MRGENYTTKPGGALGLLKLHPAASLENGTPLHSPVKPGTGTSTFSQATFNCTSLLLGLGLLSSPYAIAQTGWLGAVICVALAATNAYAAQLLVHCQRSTGCGTYQELAEAAVGRRTCLLIQVLFYTEVIGSLLGYCISIADNLAQIFPSSSFSLPGLSTRNILLLIACICVLPTIWMRDLSGLAFTSLWSVAASILLVIVVLAAASIDHIGFHHSIPLANIHGAPIAAGLYAFAFSGTTVFPNVYKSMKDPSKFTQALLWSFAITTFFVFGLGVAGAAMFGKATASQCLLPSPKPWMRCCKRSIKSILRECNWALHHWQVFAVVAAVCGTILSFQGLVESRKQHTS
ncbi:hypothetical protein GOP47_0003728 [Adiantum capillus-veneris]|uniref:Amino acid transporter transmembrane domain-containing protein n=1 Tax=Adiantum capillus-veneris TaxID=13818 RepID=A0A9D4ZPP2_ADICA|nr:hypothetical protein GOP47_0003728 [Adiantum capillus-veneris]